MAQSLATSVNRSELLVRLLFDAADATPGSSPLADPLVVQAIARSALVEMNGLGKLADYLADILPDPARW